MSSKKNNSAYEQSDIEKSAYKKSNYDHSVHDPLSSSNLFDIYNKTSQRELVDSAIMSDFNSSRRNILLDDSGKYLKSKRFILSNNSI